VATISPAGLVTALAPGTTTLVARFGTLTGSTPLTVTPPLTALTIPPGALSLPLGETLQLQAQGMFSDASTRDLTTLVTWATSNPAVASITPGGLVTTRALGVAALTATRDGIVGTLTLTVTGPRPTIAITSPTNGAIINADHVIVRGTVAAAPGDIGVTVTGYPALVNGNQWAIDLPLVPGGNAIVATATDSSGAQSSSSISVTVPQATPSPLILTAIPDSGVAPLDVKLALFNQTGRTLVQFELDATGSGTYGAPTPTFDGVTVTYTGAGLAFPMLRATDDQGTRYTATTIVNVESGLTVTARFQALWTSFKARLRARDVAGAQTMLNPELQERFVRIFQELGPDLPTIADTLGNLEVIDQVGDIAEGVVVLPRAGRPRLFFIYFWRDALGRWLIGEM
jgi:hypothetical protein